MDPTRKIPKKFTKKFGNKVIYRKYFCKGQVISKTNCQAENSPKKRPNEFVFTSMRRVFLHFLGESSDRKKRFEIY